MKPSAARTRFLERLEGAGLSLEILTPTAGVEAMMAYFTEERADGCSIDGDRDSLLFQWGIADWGHGPAFEVDLTRQLIRTDTEEKEIWQLRLVFYFDPLVGLSAGERNRWCWSLEALPEFREFVRSSPAMKAVAQHSPMSVELLYGPT